jgi:hypothetical protein
MIPPIIAIYMTWAFADSCDFAPSTKDNPLVVETRVFME